MRNIAVFGGALILGLLSGPAYGSLIGDEVDITVIMDLPTLRAEGPQILQNLGVIVDDSVELTLANEIANPGMYGGAVDVDIDGLANEVIVSVSRTFASGFADYEVIEIWLEDLDWIGDPGQITGLSLVSSTLIFDAASDPYDLDLSFTANSLHIRWSTQSDFSTFLIQQGGEARFAFDVAHDTTMPEVPEPASMMLLSLGLLGVVIRRRFTV